MGDLESQVSRTEFPTEGQLLQAAFYVSSAKFVGDREKDIHEALDVFNQEREARCQNPAQTTARVRKLDATILVYSQQLANIQASGDQFKIMELTIKRNAYAFAKDVGRSIDLLDAELVSRKPSAIFDQETRIPSIVEIGLADRVSFPKLDLEQKVYSEEASTPPGRQEAAWFISKLSSLVTPEHELIIKTPEEILEMFDRYTSGETGRHFSFRNALGAVKRQIAQITSRSEYIDIDPDGEIKTYRELQKLIEQAIEIV